MIEVEIKTVVRNREEIIEKLLQLGFQKEMQMKESDFYFDNESGDIRFSDKALRIQPLTINRLQQASVDLERRI